MHYIDTNSSLKKGFTFIELLIVVALFGILTVLVFVSLNSAKHNTEDSRLQSDVKQLRAIAEVLYNNSLSYKNVATCFNATSDWSSCGDQASQVKLLTADAITAYSGADGGIVATSNSSSLCISSRMNSGKYICVDTSGNTKLDGTGNCAGSTHTCP